MTTFNPNNIALTGEKREQHYAPPDYYTEIKDGILYRFDRNDWDYCQVISLAKVTPGFTFAHACGDSHLPQYSVNVIHRVISVRDAPLRPSDAEEAACYRRAQALTRVRRVYKFSYGQQRLFIDGIPCQGPLTRSQAKKKREFSLKKIFERREAAREQLRLERFERRWGESARTFLRGLGFKKTYIAPYVPFPALPTSVKQCKNVTVKSSIHCSVEGTYVPKACAVRDSGLAYLLRQTIKSFRPTLTKVVVNTISLRDCIKLCFIPRVFGQMDSQGAHGVPDEVTSQKVSNTVITTHNEESIGASETTVLNWHSLTTTEVEQEYTFGTERWNIYKVVEWTKGTLAGNNLTQISLPMDLMRQCWNQPSMAIFKNNRYWRSDIEFRFQLNTNKFQTGSLQCAYIYDINEDKALPYRTHVHGCSQMNHCILDASGSNMGTLVVPYKWNNPYLNTDNDKEYCRVIINVLNPLDTPSTVYGGASLTIYYRFINAKFMGTLDTNLIVKPQMLTLMRALGAAAEAGLRSVNKDLNRDKPPEPSPPVPFTPRSTSSWCIGTNLVEPTNLLRLDSSGQTPHPNINLSSMLVKDLVGIYGLLKLGLEWNVNQVTGTQLFKMDGAPMLQLDEYAEYGLDWPIYPRAKAAYAIPPVGVVSSLFAYWRGTLNVRLDIVGTPFHKGQLLVSYIPRNHKLDDKKNEITLELAKSSSYTICDLDETRSFTLNVPYISSKPMYCVRYSKGEGKDIPPPGYFTIFVLNPLIPMDDVSPQIYINIYIKAGEDFELMVPIQPSIGLPYDPGFRPEDESIVYTNKPYNPSGQCTVLPYAFKNNMPICYLSTNLEKYIGNIIDPNYIPDFALRLIKTEWFKTETYVIRLVAPVKTNLIKDRSIVEFNYAAVVERAVDYFVLCPIEKDFITDYNENHPNSKFSGLITKDDWCKYYKVSADYTETNLWGVKHPSLYAGQVLKVAGLKLEDVMWHIAEPQVEERMMDQGFLTPMSGNLVPTNSGLTILGENFSDLKNLCRRYQKLFNQLIILDNTRTDRMSICFPVTPLGIINNSSNLNDTIPELFNRCRDGVIPLITSGYRFWRGSIRYRIMTDSKIDLNIIVQHRPDITSDVYNVTNLFDNVKRNSYLNHGYSMVIQNLSVNNCVDIEVPWYNPNMLASCHAPISYDSLNDKYTLGSVFIGFNNNINIKEVGLSVYYSLGDDFRFSTFQGFPVMLSLNHVAIAQPQMFSTIKDWVKFPSELKKSNAMAEDFKESVLPKIKETICTDLSSKLINVYEVLCDLVTQLVHCLISPTTKTILWSIFSCFIKFGLLTLKAATKLTDLGCKLFNFVTVIAKKAIKAPLIVSRMRIRRGELYYRDVLIPHHLKDNSVEFARFMHEIDRRHKEGIQDEPIVSGPVSVKLITKDIQEEPTEPIPSTSKHTGHYESFFGRMNSRISKGFSKPLKSESPYYVFPDGQYIGPDCIRYKVDVLDQAKEDGVRLSEITTQEELDKFQNKYPEILNPFFDEEDEEEFMGSSHVDTVYRAKIESKDQGDDPSDIAASMISIIYASICTLVSFKCNTETDFKKYVPTLLKGIGTTASGANNIFRFIQNNFKLFTKIYEDIMYNKYWKLRRYKTIETENMDLNKWANSVSILLQPKFRTFVDNKQLWRDAVFGAARYGFLYLSDNLKRPLKGTSIDPLIRKLYDQIVNLRNELQTQKLFPSLRQEAFSLWIHGPAGVGKSTLVDDLTTKMLKSINFTHINELKYTISPVTKHWDGCNQQPVIVIDDAFAVNDAEANAGQLWAFFQICSPVPLRPPMAKLEEKSMTYNPEIFVACANEAFPKINMLRTPEALWRRRHLLVETRLNPECTTKSDYPFGMTTEQVKNFEHIQFRLAVDVRKSSTNYMAWLSYDNFVKICINKFKEFKIRSKATYEARHELHYSLYPKDLEIPEEESLRSLYSRDNDNRSETLGNLTDTFGISLDDTIKTVTNLGEEIKKIPSPPDNPVHPSLCQQAVDAAIKSMEECKTPLCLSDVLNITNKAKQEDLVAGTSTAEVQMKEVATVTQYMGLADRQAKIMSDVTKQSMRERMLEACNTAIEEGEVEESDTEILIGASEDFRNFEDSVSSAIGKFFSENDDLVTKFEMYNGDDLEGAYKVNQQIEGHPILDTVLENNCLHLLLKEDTPIITTDNKKYMFWLVEYENHVFCVYDIACRAHNCILHDKNSDRYNVYIRFIYRWYHKNYSFLRNSYKLFLANGGKNFQFLAHFNYRERVLAVQRNLVISALNRYKELGLWQGFILPSAHWLGGWLSKIVQTLRSMLSICSMLALGYFTFKMVFPTASAMNTQAASKTRSKPQLISSGDSGTHNRPNNTRLIVSKKLTAKQQNSDHCLSSVIRRRINNNTMYIEFTDNVTHRQAVMKCLVIKGRSMIVIKHYYDYLSTYTSADSECYLCWNDVGRVPFDYTKFEWDWFEDSNFGIVELPKTVSERKSLIQFLATEHQANTNVSPDCEIIDINIESMKIFNERVSYCGTVVIEPSHYSEELIMNGCWRYSRNYPGMCGSILLSKNLSNPIIGMHVAGGSGFGYSEPLTREMFSSVDKQTDGPIKEYRELDIPIIPVEERKVYLTGSHRYAGNIDADLRDGDIKLAKVESGITKIKPSLLHGLYPILSEPSPLTPTDSRLSPKFSPLVEGCEKMCNPTYEFDPSDLSQSEDDLLQKLLTHVKPLRLNVDPLSLEQSLNGIPDLPGYDHINWDTSEGFPLSRIRPTGARNKRWLFNFNDQGRAISIHDSLITIMEQKMNDRKNGIVPVTLHDDCLKDARIPKEKINVPGKTRIFSISPVDFTIQFRQYFLDFIAAYGNARFSAEHAIGINVHGLEWTDLANLVGSEHMITGDYSGFGPTLNTEVLHAAFRIIFKWYKHNGCDEESHKIRYVMSREIANARHLMRDYVYQTSCGMPSGNPGTVIFNSLVNSLYIRCAYLKIMRRTLYSGLYCFNKYVTLVTYGDDLIAKLHPNIVNNFNFNTLSLFFFDLNLKFTDAAKTGLAVEPTINLKTATFLKHCFNPHPTRPGVYLAGLDKASITECVNWVKSSPDMKDATYQNCNQATMLAYGWGPEYFNDLVNTIRVAWRDKFDEYFQCRTWEELDSLFLDQNWDPNLKW